MSVRERERERLAALLRPSRRTGWALWTERDATHIRITLLDDDLLRLSPAQLKRLTDAFGSIEALFASEELEA